MYFKLSLKNMKKSFKDFAIYFLTLVLGVAIFYMFNSIDSQQAMIKVSESTREIIKLMIQLLNYVSVFVAVVLGLLIVYANKFLINRRKKEFGIYMTLGMGRRQVSRIILLETIFVGIVSLAIGIGIGVFASQFMSVLIAKMFEADLTKFQFVFSKEACVKTCIYFAVMYLAVMIFNTITVSRYKLINLINANKKNEKVKIKNPFIAILVFFIGAGIIGYAYWQVVVGDMAEAKKILPPIIEGVVGTVLVFWSLSGLVMRIVQSIKRIYLKDTNMFILRQINNKINTNVISMSVICIMLFMTITILSTALAMRDTMEKELIENTPVDIFLYKEANLPETHMDRKGNEIPYSKEVREDSKKTIEETLKNNGVDMNCLKDVTEANVYATNELTLKTFIGDLFEEMNEKYPFVMYNKPEDIMKISEYNKIAQLYGLEKYELKDDEYMVICDFKNSLDMRNKALKEGRKLQITGKEYKAKYDECKEGYVVMSGSHINTGIIVVPDSCELTEEMEEQRMLAANYNAKTEEDAQKIEYTFSNENSELIQRLVNSGIELNGTTKISIIESSVGMATIITFIAIYLGIIFLIASSAILALKQLTESSDNKQRYTILRKIGCDETMINRALFRQIGIFFIVPLILAIIHSIFGIKFGLRILSEVMSPKDLLPSIIASSIIISVIYGLYFLATYFGSKRIIKE